jgi:hypothetical protein
MALVDLMTDGALSKMVRYLHSLWLGALFLFYTYVFAYANSDCFSIPAIQLAEMGCSSDFTTAFVEHWYRE